VNTALIVIIGIAALAAVILIVLFVALTSRGPAPPQPDDERKRILEARKARDATELAAEAEIPRESMDVDVLFVGAGPAGLAGAYRLARLAKEHDAAIDKGEKQGEKLGELQIAVLEKCSAVGSMGISGMVLDDGPLRELIPDFDKMDGFPLKTKVHKEGVYFLTEGSSYKFPIQPPPLKDHGLYVGSLSKLVRWLAKLCEDEGVQIFPGFAASKTLYDGDRVIGVRTGDKGVGHDGKHKPNFEPGMDLKAKVTVLCEGSRGNVTRDVVRKLGLDKGKNPQNYAIGVKEIIEVPEGQVQAGEVVLTMGWPLDSKTFGGAFLYVLEDNLVSLGLVIGLDYRDPNLDPQVELQRLKTHPLIGKYIAGGKVVQYGAKTIPEGGWFSMPRPYASGLLLAGDCGGFLNGERLKGVHLALKTGKLAADVIFDCLLAGDTSSEALARYEQDFQQSVQGKELWKARNFHIEFEQGLYAALVKGGMNFALGGGPKSPRPTHDDYRSYLRLDQVGGARETKAGIPYDRKLFLDKLSDVYLAGSKGEEDQPSHLQVQDTDLCASRCAQEYGNPCTRACPAAVYEMVDDEANPGKKKLHLNPTNCVHCKTCDLIDPYLNIRWVVPEGGDGPNYSQM